MLKTKCSQKASEAVSPNLQIVWDRVPECQASHRQSPVTVSAETVALCDKKTADGVLQVMLCNNNRFREAYAAQVASRSLYKNGNDTDT